MKPSIEKLVSAVQSSLLSFFQTSSRTVYVSSLIALLAAIALFPVWHHVFTVRDVSVQMLMSAPKEGYVRVYWDTPDQHPQSFERIRVRKNFRVNQELFREYEFSVVKTRWQRLQIVAEKGTDIQIPWIQVDGQTLQQEEQQFRLPRYFWRRANRTLFATVMSWIVMTGLFISTTHIWQRQRYKRFGLISYILILAMAASGFWMLVFYPGILSHDGVNHWGQALQNQYNAWWPPILAMGMHITQYWVDNPSLFTFIQGFIFWTASFYLIWQVVQKDRCFLISSSLFLLIFPIWLYSNAAVSNTWMASFVLLSTATLIQFIRSQQRRYFLGSVICLSLAVCFRREAIFLAIIPIAIYFYYLILSGNQRAENWLRAWSRFAGVTLAILLLTLIPSKLITLSPNVSGQSPTGYVFLSQYVGTLARIKNLDPSQTGLDIEQAVFDQKFGSGTLEALLDSYRCASSQTTIRTFQDSDFQEQSKQAILFENTNFVLSRALKVALQHPKAYLSHKRCNLSYLLQRRMIKYDTWGIVGDSPNMSQFDLQPDSRLLKVQAIYARILQKMLHHPVGSLWFRHYIFLALSVMFLVFGAVTRRPEFLIPSLFGLVYPIGLMIPDAFPHWRYLFVCYVLTWICLLEAGNLLVIQGWQWWQRQQGESNESVDA